MNDLELTKKCAEKMGLNWEEEEEKIRRLDGAWRTYQETEFDPLHNDSQAMALVKKFRLSIFDSPLRGWTIHGGRDETFTAESGTDLNRAICECVAKMP